MSPNVLPNFLPNFLIVGAPKSGSTSLYHLARAHPQVFMPAVKEPRFFVAERFREIDPAYGRRDILLSSITFTLDDYAALFAGVTDEIAVGEASPQYLALHAMAIPGIRRVLGDPKIAIILRDPVERALSGYNALIRRHATDLSLEALIDAGKDFDHNRYPPFFQVVGTGFYAAQVRAYQDSFRDVRVMLLDDLERDPAGFMAGFHAWLGVDPALNPGPPSAAGNPDALPEAGTRFNVTPDKIPLAPATRARLKALYRDDVRELARLTGHDLSHWLA